MKRFLLLLCAALILTGCADTDRELERGMELRNSLLESTQISFTADITADYGDKVHTFSMRNQVDQQGNLIFSVQEPQSIAGITGTIRESGGALTFDDTALAFPLLADGQLSPVSAPWILMKTLRSGYITSACREGELLRLTIDDSYSDDALTMDIWLNGENLPVHGQVLYDGRNILTISVTEFVIG